MRLTWGYGCCVYCTFKICEVSEKEREDRHERDAYTDHRRGGQGLRWDGCDRAGARVDQDLPMVPAALPQAPAGGSEAVSAQDSSCQPRRNVGAVSFLGKRRDTRIIRL